MIDLQLKLTAPGGARLPECLKKAAFIAKLLDIYVSFEFNDYEMLISPTPDIEKIAKRYYNGNNLGT